MFRAYMYEAALPPTMSEESLPNIDVRVGVQLQAEVGVGGEHAIRLRCKRLEAEAAKILRALLAVHVVLDARAALDAGPRQLAVAIWFRLLARRSTGSERADDHK